MSCGNWLAIYVYDEIKKWICLCKISLEAKWIIAMYVPIIFTTFLKMFLRLFVFSSLS